MKYLLLLVCIFITSKSFTQTTTTKINKVGVNHTLKSKVLKQDKIFQVYLPGDYQNSDKNYPVIYLLDGQRFFLYGVSLFQSFHEFDLTPDFIVVGITNDQSQRMLTFSTGGDDFLDYLQTEVVPFMDSNYRTSENKLLFGWAYAGGFGINVMMKSPSLFNGFILSSPFPSENKIEPLDEFLNLNKNLNTFFYFTSDKEEYGVKEGTEALKTFLENKQSNLRWNFKELIGEEHRSTPYTTLYHGIQAYFDNYQELSFATLEEFNNAGGLAYFNEYYKIRHEKYGKDLQPSSFNKYGIVRLAMRANEFEMFKNLFKQLGEEDLLKELRASRACGIAEFYLENGDRARSNELFTLILEANPNSERALDGFNKTSNQ